MYDFSISKEQARQFAYDCFDVIMLEEQSQNSSENNQQKVA